MASKKEITPTPIETVKHRDRRVNIPTEELRDFVAEYEAKPKTVFYPRDPSLDPQLVWKGKDEQDSKDLAVPAVPIYIQEKIQPKAIIENVRAEARKERQEPQISLFADFNGIEFEDLVDFYKHEQNWSNRMILGDSLLVMTSLAEKEGLKGKVQMIYIDPPYGIRFGSNWQVSTRKREVKDGKAEDLTRQPEQIRAFRDTWKLGIHSYLSYLRDRLIIARELLTETGSVFVQIGDENVHLVRSLMDEVFGSENFIAQIYFVATTGRQEGTLDRLGNYLLWFARHFDQVKFRRLFLEKDKDNGSEEVSFGDLQSQGVRSTGSYGVIFGGKTYQPFEGNHWKITEEGMKRLVISDRVKEMKSVLRFVRYRDDFPARPIADVWTDTSGGAGPDKIYVVQTSNKILERCVLMTTDPGDLVLDPTCGSGTTAYVAEQWGRRWITIDTSRVALALARTRLMASKFPYFLLADSSEGNAKGAELSGKTPPSYKTEADIKKGFVYKRVPHITLKSIANNPEIKEGMTREEIDAAIARHAETEILYDQPYEDNKRIRVTGPFTMESLSPHRVLAADDVRVPPRRDGRLQEGRAPQQAGTPPDDPSQFVHMILENLKKAGVQNTIKQERLKFDRLEPFAGQWIHAAGEYTESDKKARRVAICIGPEHGTVGPQLVKEAAKEAVQGVGFDLLVVCGFAFDPHVSEEAKRYGKLTVLMARMNPDLAMGDELLKKTGAGNLFMVFGEPDIVIRHLEEKPDKKGKKKKGRQPTRGEAPTNGKIVVEIKGVDVYDPTTGQIRSSSTDDIACWFIDTEYNGESFFVRHAYFTGSDEPYEKLKRALRAEVDESAWSALYSTRSTPFPFPKTGKIAVKVINHYGDEVLKVYEPP